MSERITEQIVRDHLQKHEKAAGALWWEQTPEGDAKVKDLLKKASKTGRGGIGRPEFTVRFEEQSDLLVVIECKALITKHQSKNKDNAENFAVDGVLHYAKHLSKGFNVLAIAVSGTKKSALSVSHFWHLKGDATHKEAEFPSKLLPLAHYLEGYRSDRSTRQHGVNLLEKLARDLNSRLHISKVTPADRALLVAAIIVALRTKEFRDSYSSLNGADLLKRVKDVFMRKMRAAGVNEFGLKGIKGKYGFLNDAGTGVLSVGTSMPDMVSLINEQGMPVIEQLGAHDSIGKFYLEFLRYSNNDKELGIVLTPPHITDFAAELAEVGKNDVVYDNCAGTGGFLVAAMKRMLGQAKGDEEKQSEIKQNRVVGVELNSGIISLLHCNMFLHGDGRSNMKLQDCLTDRTVEEVKTEFAPSVGLLNPPFKDKSLDIEEMQFVLNMLDTLSEGGRCVALLPMPWARIVKGRKLALKDQLLKKHTLEAVISLPDKLFYNSKASVVTCMMVFTAHRPHAKNKKTWFAYGKNDGFEMRQHFGRLDFSGKWPDIMGKWVSSYRNRETIPGFSIMTHVGAEDEWCAESYIQADYQSLNLGDWQRVVRDYEINQIYSKWDTSSTKQAISDFDLVKVSDIFNISKGHGLSYNMQNPDANGVNFINRGSARNGVKGRVSLIPDIKPKPAGTLTVAASGSVMETFIQDEPFYTGVGNLCLSPKSPMSHQVKLFYCMLIRANKFRYNYGREATTTLRDVLLPSIKSVPKWVEKTPISHLP